MEQYSFYNESKNFKELILYICEKFCIISFALNLAINLLELYFTLKTYFKLITFLS